MKMSKVLAMVLAMAMIFALCACGAENAPAETNKTESAVSTTETTTESTTPAAGSFKFAAIGPMTGDAAIYGNAVMNAVQIAVDEINAAGGINGFPIEFKPADDEADGEKSVNAYNNAMDWGAQLIIGPVTSGAAISVSAVAFDERTFCLTPSASSTDVTAGKDNVFQLCFTDPNQGTGSADYISANIDAEAIAVIYRNDDAYSQGIRDTFIKRAAELNLNVVYEGTFTADTQTDFSVQLTAAQAAGADLVYLPIYYTPASVILTQANAMGYAPLFFGVDGMDGILTIEGFDVSLAEGVMLLTPFAADAQDDLTKNFVGEFQKRFGEVPNQFAADGYDCVYALKQALEAVNATPDMSASDLCEALVGVFTTISFNGLTGTGMTWASNGEVSKMPAAVVINNGAYVSAN